uniref:Platelet-derived growth factor (PDGF) family profile domain-containing protein n=1 Tax=Sphenodon punctatus TaxID=8508 RepID=A0A8D0GDX7_SPHPU
MSSSSSTPRQARVSIFRQHPRRGRTCVYYMWVFQRERLFQQQQQQWAGAGGNGGAVSEYPGEVEHMFSPSCISLRRCMGCCGDEKLQCVPVETANITMQLLKVKSEGQAPYMELSFAEHRQCECRPRQDTLKPGRRRRPKGRGKRKREKQRPKD